MEIIVGTITMKNDKILMVKEAKKTCYSKWAFPAGHLEKNETLFEGAKRETKEETGCNVQIKKVFPVYFKNKEDRSIMLIHFLSNFIDNNSMFDTNEILETKWIPISELKKMKEDEFRSYHIVKEIIDNFEHGKVYDLEILKAFEL